MNNVSETELQEHAVILLNDAPLEIARENDYPGFHAPELEIVKIWKKELNVYENQ